MQFSQNIARSLLPFSKYVFLPDFFDILAKLFSCVSEKHSFEPNITAVVLCCLPKTEYIVQAMLPCNLPRLILFRYLAAGAGPLELENITNDSSGRCTMNVVVAITVNTCN
jgi:hypothetical protein